jgi:HEAT repeat protein
MRGAASWEARATAARGLGVLRGQAAVNDLVEALSSKDDQLMFEALVALQKVRDPQAGPKLAFLVRDLNPQVKVAALQAVGILRAGAAIEDIHFLLENAPSKQIEREGLTALAMIADPGDRPRFLAYLANRDENLRAAAAEGLARINDPQDLMAIETAFTNERDSNPRLSLAFALVAHGRREMSQFSALQYLVSTLNRRAYRNVAIAFLTELTREPLVRQAIYPALTGASKDEKTGLAIVLGRSAGRDALPYLDALQNESDVEVAQAALNSLRAIESRTR